MKNALKKIAEVVLTLVFVFYCVFAVYILIDSVRLASTTIVPSGDGYRTAKIVTPSTVLFFAMAFVTAAAGVLAVIRLFSKRGEIVFWTASLAAVSVISVLAANHFSRTFDLVVFARMYKLFGAAAIGRADVIVVCFALAALVSEALQVVGWFLPVKGTS